MNFSRRVGARFNRGRIDDDLRVSSSAWTPADINGLVLWLDNQLITEAGGLVTAWPDLSDEENDGVQASPALQGDYEALGWNGTQPSVFFAGQTSQEHLTFDSGTLPTVLSGDDKPYTITLVYQITSTWADVNRYLFSAGNSGTDNQLIAFGGTSASVYRLLQRDDTPTASLASSVVAPNTNRHQATCHFNGTTRTLYLDGVSIATDSTALGTCTLNRFTLGILRRSGLNEGVNFRTPGMTIYSRALSAPELALVWQYNRDHFTGLP